MTVVGGISAGSGDDMLGAAMADTLAANRRLRILERAGGLGTYELIPSEGRVLVSEGFCELLGLPVQPQFPIDALKALLEPADLEALQASGNDFGVGYVEYRVRRPDNGETRWIARRGEAAEAGDGSLHHFGVCFDITERKAVEEALRRSDERLRAALEGSGAGTFRWDMRTNEAELDDQLDRLLGFEPGKGPRSLKACLASIHPDDHAEFLAKMERSASVGEDFDMTFRVRLPDGGERWLHDRGKVHRDPSGTPLYMTGACTDVTQQTATARRLDAVLESITDSFLAFDADWNITLVNRAAERFLGFDRRRALGRNLWEFFPETVGTELERGLRRVMETRRPYRFEIPSVRRPDKTIEMRVAPKDGGGIAVNFSDVTKRKEAERLRELLVGELNHRVKNTLALVHAAAQQTFRGSDTPPAALRAFEGRLAALAAAHDVLTMRSWENVLLGEVVAAALAPFGAADGDRISWNGPALPLSAQSGISFALAIHELATNAAKYGALSGEGGKVAIEWGREGPEEAPRLRFEWKERDGPPVAKPQSMGFGARMIQRALAAELGGKVEIDFAPEGVCCRIDAPLADTGSASE